MCKEIDQGVFGNSVMLHVCSQSMSNKNLFKLKKETKHRNIVYCMSMYLQSVRRRSVRNNKDIVEKRSSIGGN